jgi:hypothetical protein
MESELITVYCYLFVCFLSDSNDQNEILNRARSLLNKLPQAHFETMNYLFKFLHRFSVHSVKTLMDKRYVGYLKLLLSILDSDCE